MGTNKFLLFTSIFLLASCSPESEQLNLALEPCTALGDTAARIECYDQIAIESGLAIAEIPASNIEEKIAQLTEIAQELELPVPRVVGSDNTLLAEIILEAAAMNDMETPTVSVPLSADEVDALISVASNLSLAFDRAMFLELVLATTPRKTGVELAVQINDVSSMSELDGGNLGIPNNIESSYSMHGAQVEDGKITMTWKNDLSELNGVTYSIQLNELEPPLTWTESGTCLDLGLC